MALSTVGSVRFKVYGVLLLVNTIVLALSGHINHFQQFFYRADVFPFALSLVTEVFILIMIFLDINSKNAFTARPPFELGWLFVIGVILLAFNAFSTSRWRYAGMGVCATIPSDAQYAPYRTWCHELQALRVFVWIEWILLLFTFAYLLWWTINKHNSGRHDVWSISFSRFSENASTSKRYRGGTNSEFLQWEKFPSTVPQSPQQPVLEPVQASSPRPTHTQYIQSQYAEDPFTRPPQILYSQPPHPQYITPSQTLSSQPYYSESPQAF